MKTKKTANIVLSILLSLFMAFSTAAAPAMMVQAEEMVLVTKTGSKYHKRKCGNGTYSSSTLSAAKARGLTPCEKCFGNGGTSSSSNSQSTSMPVAPDQKPDVTTNTGNVETAASTTPVVNQLGRFNGCKGVPVEINIPTDVIQHFSFSCDDNCGLLNEYIGSSQASIGETSAHGITYKLTFNVPGVHNVSVFDNSGTKKDTAIFQIADEHNYGNATEYKKVTCTTDGMQEYTCLNCGEKKEETVPATGHDFGEWILSTPSTAIAEGQERRECQICGEKEYKNLDRLVATVSLSERVLTLKVGKSATLKIDDVVKGDYILKWKNSNPKVASFSRKGGKDCVIKAKKPGKTKITVVMRSGCKAMCTVTVK